MSFSTGSSAVVTEINVTPMIDVLLVLIVIFMVIQPVSPQGLTSSIPKPSRSSANPAQPVVVRLLSDGQGAAQYRIGTTEVPPAQLSAQLQAAFDVRLMADRTLFVEADRSLSYHSVAEVAGIGRSAGAVSIVLAKSE